MQQQARALQVPEKANTEADAVGGALDQPGNVGDDETAMRREAHDPEVRVQRRERVVGDLRPRRRDRANEGRLAGVRQAEQADVGDDLELEAELELLARRARRGFARRAVGRTLEARVADTVEAAAGDEDALARPLDVGDQFAAVERS